MATIFAKMSAELDVNPKIRAAGRDGREVFLFVLRMNSLLNAAGAISVSYIDPKYLAEMLMVTEDNARNGVSRAIVTSLLAIDEAENVVRIVGWTDDYGRRPQSNAERQASLRARRKKETENAVTESNGAVTDAVTNNESNVLDQIRSEEKRERASVTGSNGVTDRSELSRRLSAAKRIYEAQESARKRVQPDCQPTAAIACQDRIAKLLMVHAEQDLLHAIAIYEAEAMASESVDRLRYFNGVSNWKPEQIERAMSRTVEGVRADSDRSVKRAANDQHHPVRKIKDF